MDNHEDVCKMAVDYFKDIFAGGDHGASMQMENTEARVITDVHNAKLTTKITFAEFTLTVKKMHPDKTASLDGFSPAIFQHFWDLIGVEIFNCCRNWLT